MATIKQTLISLASFRAKRAELDKKIVQAEQKLAADFAKLNAESPKKAGRKPAAKSKAGTPAKRTRKPKTPKAPVS
jgi:hypothetical protein